VCGESRKHGSEGAVAQECATATRPGSRNLSRIGCKEAANQLANLGPVFIRPVISAESMVSLSNNPEFAHAESAFQSRTLVDFCKDSNCRLFDVYNQGEYHASLECIS
jgi:hypothetical protein